MMLILPTLRGQDNCNDDATVKIIVKSNEVQQNNIAELFKYQLGDSNPQVTTFYAATT